MRRGREGGEAPATPAAPLLAALLGIVRCFTSAPRTGPLLGAPLAGTPSSDAAASSLADAANARLRFGCGCGRRSEKVGAEGREERRSSGKATVATAAEEEEKRWWVPLASRWDGGDDREVASRSRSEEFEERAMRRRRDMYNNIDLFRTFQYGR